MPAHFLRKGNQMTDDHAQPQEQAPPPPTMSPPGKNNSLLVIIVLLVVGLVVVCGGLSVGVLLPAISRARDVARVSAEGAALRGIGQALLIYADEHKGDFPPHVGVLFADGMVQPDQLVSKAQPDAPPPAYQGEQPTGNYTFGDFHFVYLQSHGTNARGDSILAFGRAHPNGARNVLFADCSVRAMRDAQFLEHVRRDNTESRANRPQQIDPNVFGDVVTQPGYGSGQ